MNFGAIAAFTHGENYASSVSLRITYNVAFRFLVTSEQVVNGSPEVFEVYICTYQYLQQIHYKNPPSSGEGSFFFRRKTLSRHDG